MGLEDRFRTVPVRSRSGPAVARLGHLVPGCPSQLESIEVEQHDAGFTTRAGADLRRQAVADSWWKVLDAAVDRWLPTCGDRSEILLLAVAVIELPWSVRMRAIRQKLEAQAFGLRGASRFADTT